MSVSTYKQGVPFPITSFTAPGTGTLTQPAYLFLLNLWNRTGGAAGSNPLNALLAANNLSDLANAHTALENLGISVGGILQVDTHGNASKLLIGSGLNYDGHTLSVGAIAKPTTGAAVIAGPGYMYSNAGVATVINANATVGDPTNGSYAPCNCWISQANVGGQTVPVYMANQFVGGTFSPGQTYWLDVNSGLMVTTPPSTAGNGNQTVGIADDTGTMLFFDPGPMIGV